MQAAEFARTKNVLDLDSVGMAGILAGICYLKDDFESLVKQEAEKHVKRGLLVAGSGHHSCYCHEYSTIILSGVPKIVAMMLNSLHFYNTSEKSGRYTVMDDCSDEEKEIYDKWKFILANLAKEYYPFLSEADAEKRGKENARKMLSVFTPTVMAYTTSIQQWNYIYDWCKNFESQRSKGRFYGKLADALDELAEAIKPIIYVEGVRDNKSRGFDFLTYDMEVSKTYYGSVYSTVYKASFDEIAQCERHRVLDLVMHINDTEQVPNNMNFAVPAIIRENAELKANWLADMKKLAKNFPVGMLVLVEERGTFMAWRKSKSLERDCGCAQLEIMQRNEWLRKRFEEHKKNLTARERRLLEEMSRGVRCTYPDFKCTHKCVWGPVIAKERLI